MKPVKSVAKNEICNILFVGTGGQGVLTASEVVGWAAMYDGRHVKKSEVHGMAQRGGSVESHLRFSGWQPPKVDGRVARPKRSAAVEDQQHVYSPLIPKGRADFLVSFYKDEHDRMKDFLKKGGIDLIDALEAAQKTVSDPRFINTFILGVLSKHLPIAEENWKKALEHVFKGKRIEKNLAVFMQGRKMI
jgi:indolepyruvate ferredoxin oxidoreductase beta subunit